MTDEMLDAWDRLNKIAYRVQVTQASELSAAMRELESARECFAALVTSQLNKK
jgi:hypothetical protein